MAPKKDLYLQALRGLAIASVVMIHCLPLEAWVVGVRPFLNFAVALFIFLSGYLTTKRKVADIHSFYRKRIGKIVIPYSLWTLFYLLARGVFVPATVLLAFFTGDAAAQLYYLIVYLQLVLLTPLLYRLLAYPIARALLYAVTPTALLIRYDFSLVSVSIPIQEFFGFWLIFYLLGLEWRSRISPWLDSKGIAMPQAVMIFVVCIALQEVEGFLWLSLGNFDLATTQLKVTSALSSIAVIAVLMRLKDRTPHWLEACRPLTRLGDVSFGVYLCHMVPVMLWGILLPKDGLLLAIARWAVSLVASTVVTMALHRVLPRKISVAIGF